MKMKMKMMKTEDRIPNLAWMLMMRENLWLIEQRGNSMTRIRRTWPGGFPANVAAPAMTKLQMKSPIGGDDICTLGLRKKHVYKGRSNLNPFGSRRNLSDLASILPYFFISCRNPPDLAGNLRISPELPCFHMLPRQTSAPAIFPPQAEEADTFNNYDLKDDRKDGEQVTDMDVTFAEAASTKASNSGSVPVDGSQVKLEQGNSNKPDQPAEMNLS